MHADDANILTLTARGKRDKAGKSELKKQMHGLSSNLNTCNRRHLGAVTQQHHEQQKALRRSDTAASRAKTKELHAGAWGPSKNGKRM